MRINRMIILLLGIVTMHSVLLAKRIHNHEDWLQLLGQRLENRSAIELVDWQLGLHYEIVEDSDFHYRERSIVFKELCFWGHESNVLNAGRVFEEKYLPTGITWCSFPILDTRSYGATQAQAVLPPIMNNYALESILSEGNTDFVFHIPGSGWQGLTNSFASVDGYKIEMNDDGKLPLIGFCCPSNTTIHLDGNNQENWIGYFLEESRTAEKAFPEVVWNDIKLIQHQDWAMARIKDDWVIEGSGFTINPGDMVIVKCNNNHDFMWNSSGSSQPPVDKATAQQFSYTEKPDYTPIFLELDPQADRPDEIGVLVDGQCYGASVVCDSVVQINGYLSGVPDSVAQTMEFSFYYANKAAAQPVAQYWVVNPQANIREKRCLDLQADACRSGEPVFVSFKELSAPQVQMPLTLALEQNHPNPFNPETQIAFALPQAANVQLAIYNIKGQRVKTLVDGALDAGHHSVLWNGVNESGEDVASGVYFSRLQAGSKNIHKKRRLLK